MMRDVRTADKKCSAEHRKWASEPKDLKLHFFFLYLLVKPTEPKTQGSSYIAGKIIIMFI